LSFLCWGFTPDVFESWNTKKDGAFLYIAKSVPPLSSTL
jgi:hypothetical protein